jgi:hypothetical protein
LLWWPNQEFFVLSGSEKISKSLCNFKKEFEMKNPIQENTGSEAFLRPTVVIMLLIFIVAIGIIAVKIGPMIGLAIILIPGLFFFLNRLFNNPQFGVYIVFLAGFTVNGITRYLGDYPFGLSIDIILILTYIAIFFKEFNRKMDWSSATNDLTLVALIWFSYALLQLLNPEAVSKTAWFYAMRGESLYMLLTVPLVMMLMNKYRNLNTFLYLWAIISIIATIKGVIQLKIGLDPWEQKWINAGAYTTHILFGKLRVFSFYSDAGQFGAAQAHAGLVGTILFLHTKLFKERLLFGIMAIAGFYGMFISGTRGSIAVIFAGFFIYLVLTRNLRMITIGTLVGISFFVFFKFTTIGNEVYAINRMRTAFNPEDPSLLLRLENQKKLRVYLADKPFGGGIGSSAYWGKRFSPNSYLSSIATDSWYVVIWAEQGIVGLALHLIILFYIIGRGAFLSMFRVRDPVLQGKLFALNSGILGIMAASYGNAVLGQMPTAIMIYSSMAFLFLAKRIDNEIKESETELKRLDNKIGNQTK